MTPAHSKSRFSVLSAFSNLKTGHRRKTEVSRSQLGFQLPKQRFEDTWTNNAQTCTSAQAHFHLGKTTTAEHMNTLRKRDQERRRNCQLHGQTHPHPGPSFDFILTGLKGSFRDRKTCAPQGPPQFFSQLLESSEGSESSCLTRFDFFLSPKNVPPFFLV